MHDVFYGLCAAYVVTILVTARYASLGEDNGSLLEAIYESGTLFKSVTGTLYTIISLFGSISDCPLPYENKSGWQ